MKKIYFLLAIVLLFPTAIFATSSYNISDDGGSFISGKNHYEAGGIVNIPGDTVGDVYAVGGMLNFKNKVGEDLTAIGGVINVLGDVGGDVRVIGGNIMIEGNIAGDLIANGGQILIGKNTKIGGNLVLNGGNLDFNGEVAGDTYINGGNLKLNGNISGNVELRAEEITVLNSANIKGNLLYFSKKQYSNLESVVGGNKEFKPLEIKGIENKNELNKKISKGILGLVGVYILYRFLFLLVFGAILYFAFEKLFRETATILEKNYWKSFFLGLAYYGIFPAVIVLLFATIIGIPFGLFFLFAYIFSFVFYKLFIVLIFSSLIINKYLAKGKILKTTIPFWKKLGVIALIALVITPWSLIDLFIAFFAVGAIVMKKFEIIKGLK